MSNQSGQVDALDVRGAAALLGVSTATIRKWVFIRELPYYKLGSRVTFDRDELLSYRQRHRVESIGAQG